jgi:hypothetical protein
VFLFMQFLSRYNRGVRSPLISSLFPLIWLILPIPMYIRFEKSSILAYLPLFQAIPSENKSLARTQTAVLRHITMLLGYNPQDKCFFLQPGRVRSSPVFNSFVSNLPQVLDQNFRVGATILPISLSVLHYSPAPSKSAGSRMHPSYSLWYLEPHVRRHWLFSLIVILYKVRKND